MKTDATFEQSFTFVEINLDEVGKYPYEQVYLPYNRLADGTVHDW